MSTIRQSGSRTCPSARNDSAERKMFVVMEEANSNRLTALQRLSSSSTMATDGYVDAGLAPEYMVSLAKKDSESEKIFVTEWVSGMHLNCPGSRNAAKPRRATLHRYLP